MRDTTARIGLVPIALISLLATGCVTPMRPTLPNIAYAGTGEPQQRIDVYRPAKGGDAPIVLFVHGGEWTKGDKANVDHKPAFLTGAGIVFVSVNYRLSGTAHHPAQVDDVAAAVRYVRDHAREWGGDPGKIVLLGHSAGCHIVSMVGLDPRPLEKVGMKPADLAGVVSWSGGAFDLVAKAREGGMYSFYIHANFGESEAAWRDASPVAHVGESKPIPPFLYASAGDGRPASRLASERMVAIINGNGGQAEAVTLKGKSHGTANSDLGAPGDPINDILLQFVRRACGPRPR